MATSLFGTGNVIVNAAVNGTLVPQYFIGTAGQTVFTLTAFTYTPGTNSIFVYINGVKQITTKDFQETSSTSIALLNGVVVGDIVEIIGCPNLTLVASTAAATSFDWGITYASGTAGWGTRVGNIVSYQQPQSAGLGFTQQQYNWTESIAGTGGQFVDLLQLNHLYGGSSVLGGRNTVEIASVLTAATSASNTNRNYVAFAPVVRADSADGGTGLTGGTAKGGFFAMNPVATLNVGVQNVFNVSCGEFNVSMRAGSSAYYKSGIQIVGNPDDVQRGTVYDAALMISSQAGSVGWNNGIGFSAANGIQGVQSAGTLIRTIDAGTAANGIDFSNYTFVGSAWRSKGFSIGALGDLFVGDNSLGARTQSMLLSSGGGSASYDTRIVSLGGSGGATVGLGTMRFDAALFQYVGVTVTTSATVGAASAIPGAPAIWVTENINGVAYKKPYWNT